MREIFCLLAMVFGALAVLKFLYVVGTVSVLPKTKGALFVPTSGQKIKAILDVLPLSSDMRVVDLGCGDGRFLRAVWRKYRIKAEGFEINLWAVFVARFLNFCWRTPAKVYRKDFFQVDLSRYDLVFCYLFPDLLLDLRAKLDREIREGAWLVSCNFPVPGWKPWKILQVGDPIFIYRKGFAERRS